jgi:hypothetical protein
MHLCARKARHLDVSEVIVLRVISYSSLDVVACVRAAVEERRHDLTLLFFHVDQALKDAREIGHAASLMYALAIPLITHLLLGNYAAATAQADELVAVAEEKRAALWKAFGTRLQGCVLAETGKASEAVPRITSGIAAWRSTGATLWLPTWLSYLAKAYADLRQFEDAWRCIDEASAAVNRKQGEVVGGRDQSHCRRNRADGSAER